MDQSQAPVLEALAAFQANPLTVFTPPGHKQGRGADPRVLATMGSEVFRADVLATGGLDDRLDSRGILAHAQELMAEAVGADHTFFSTCGSSLSVKAAMLAVAGPHEELVVGRDAHKSVVAGLILAGIRPVWVDPCWDAGRHLAHPPSAAAVRTALDGHPTAQGALITSPTPYGTCADLEAIAGACHERGKPLIVDEAWGAHLPFHPRLPRWAMDAGADVCVTSVHKMGSALEQSSVFHLQGDLVEAAVLKQREDLLGTTSPSTLVYAALDGWRRQMVQHGRALYDRTLDLADDTRARIDAIDGLHVHGREDFCGPRLAADLDPFQVVIDISALGTSGYLAGDWLRSHHQLTLHVCDHRRVSAQLTHADDSATTGALLHGLTELVAVAEDLTPVSRVNVPAPDALRLEQAMLPRDAFFGPTEQVPVDKAADRIAAEMLTPYPPGIPAALPGERLTDDVLDYLRSGLRAGMLIPDSADAALTTVRVAVETHTGTPHTGRPGDPVPATSGLDRAAVLARQITSALAAAGHTVAVAESLTGGRLATVLADAPGAGRTFLGGVVAYATDLKSTLLNVDSGLLADEGAVHPEVAAQMAQGIRAATGATYTLATTGVAGPSPQDGRPVGTVHIALAGPDTTVTAEPRPHTGDREDIQHTTVLAALRLLHDHLRPPVGP